MSYFGELVGQGIGAYIDSQNNSAKAGQAAGNPIDTSYHFGDLITGAGAAKTQAYNQWLLDQQERLYNSAEAQKNRDFQEYMSSTEVQRRMADYQAAGLNPYLAIQNVGGSVPAGSSASSSSGNANMAQSRLGEFGSSALGMAVLIRTIAKVLK